jgi:hypothetical protein
MGLYLYTMDAVGAGMRYERGLKLGIVGTRERSAFLFPTIYRAILSLPSIVRAIFSISWTAGGTSQAETFLQGWNLVL